MPKVIYKTREEWLVAAVDMLRGKFEAAGTALPEKVKVSIGFPPKGGLGKRKRVLGVCFTKDASADKVHQIYINPVIEQIGGKEGILSVLTHELVHACGISGHGAAFRKVGEKVGLTGNMASSVAAEWLQDYFEHIMEVLGAFPYSHIIPTQTLSSIKPDKCRMHKCVCGECGYTIRISNKWYEMGVPECPLCDGVDLEREEK